MRSEIDLLTHVNLFSIWAILIFRNDFGSNG